MDQMSRKFISNFVVLFFGTIGMKIITFLLVPYYTNILTPGEYGTIDIINTDASILVLLLSVGIPDAIFRYVMNTECDDKEILKISFAITTSLFLFACSILVLINFHVQWPFMQYLLAQVILSLYYSIITNYIKAKQYTRYYVLIGIVQTLILVLCNILFLSCFRLGIKGYLISVIFSYLLPVLFVFCEKRIFHAFRASFNLNLLKRMFHYGFPLIFLSLSGWIMSSCDRYMLLYLYGEEKVGIYSVATRISVILQVIISVLDIAWNIFATDVYENSREELPSIFNLFMKYFRTVGVVSCSVLLFFTKPIMTFMARNDFFEAWRYAPILIISMVFPFICERVNSLYKVYESNKGLMLSVVFGCILNVVMNLMLIKPFGIMGAATATMLSRAFIALFQLKDTEKFLDFDRDYKSILYNTLILILQSIALIHVKKNIYFYQFLFLLLICFMNRMEIKLLIKNSKNILYNTMKTKLKERNGCDYEKNQK